MKNFPRVITKVPSMGYALLLLATWASGARSQPAPGFQGLGRLQGDGSFSRAWDVSADGSMVIGYSTSGITEEGGEASPRYEAFRWTRAEGMVGLGFLAGGESPFSEAIAVAADGLVIAGQSTSGASVSSEAFRWTSVEGMKGLGFLPGGSRQSWGMGVSPDGSAVVGFGFSGEGLEAFRWTEQQGMVGLGDLAGGKFSSRAWDTALHGDVVVGVSRSEEGGGEAFLWTSQAGMTGLGFLSREGLALDAIGSEAHAVSADGGTVVGHSHSAGGDEAFRWTPAGGMVGLGDLPGGDFKSAAWGVAADGSVIVGVGTTGEGEEAFLWDSAHGMRALKGVLLEGDFGGELSGWRLLAARRVSDSGLVVVGEGLHEGHGTEAWRAVLPPAQPPGGPQFIRGDCNSDGAAVGQVADAVALLTFNFSGGARPGCLVACDANGDGKVTGQVGDAIYMLHHNFLGGPPPVPPFPDCGLGLAPGDASLGCEEPPQACR